MFSGDGREGVSQPGLGSDAYKSLDIGPRLAIVLTLALWPASRQPLASKAYHNRKYNPQSCYHIVLLQLGHNKTAQHRYGENMQVYK